MKKKLVLTAVLIAFLFTGFATVLGVYSEAEPIRESVVRLHIMADSDDNEAQRIKQAQRIKLQVRNEILDQTEGVFGNETDPACAREIVQENIPLFEQVANERLAELGAPYTARVSYEPHYFPTRTYGAVSLPAGEYDSLVIRLGSGEGKNWWCVMFPPLCYDGEEVAAEEESLEILQQNLEAPEYDLLTGEAVVRFKLLEFFGSLFQK